jgi:hypothetical protein
MLKIASDENPLNIVNVILVHTTGSLVASINRDELTSELIKPERTPIKIRAFNAKTVTGVGV